MRRIRCLAACSTSSAIAPGHSKSPLLSPGQTVRDSQ